MGLTSISPGITPLYQGCNFLSKRWCLKALSLLLERERVREISSLFFFSYICTSSFSLVCLSQLWLSDHHSVCGVSLALTPCPLLCYIIYTDCIWECPLHKCLSCYRKIIIPLSVCFPMSFPSVTQGFMCLGVF